MKTTDEDQALDQVASLFEESHATKEERFEWGTDVVVLLQVMDDLPGSVQSGHYLWPAARYLADYIVSMRYSISVDSVMELGAGTALASLTALQVWKLRCVIVTDHDPSVLKRAKSNYELTLQKISDKAKPDEGRKVAAEGIASVPILFEWLKWGVDAHRESDIRAFIRNHSNSRQGRVDLILGSDLIYCKAEVNSLLQTVSKWMSKVKGRFLLSQSFSFDSETEKEIDVACIKWRIRRRILSDSSGGSLRIQEFSFQDTIQDEEESLSIK